MTQLEMAEILTVKSKSQLEKVGLTMRRISARTTIYKLSEEASWHIEISMSDLPSRNQWQIELVGLIPEFQRALFLARLTKLKMDPVTQSHLDFWKDVEEI